MAESSCFSIIFYKSQLPFGKYTYDVVVALRKRFKDEDIDCVQALHGVIRVDLNSKEAFRNLLTKGLVIGRNLIFGIKYQDGMDDPSMQIRIEGLPKNQDENEIYEGLIEIGVVPMSKIEHHYYKDKEEGTKIPIKSGKKLITIKKPSSPLPKEFQVGNRVGKIWYWGQEDEEKDKDEKENEKPVSGNVFQKKTNPWQKNNQVQKRLRVPNKSPCL